MEKYLGVELASYKGALGVEIGDMERYYEVTEQLRLDIIKKHRDNGVKFICVSEVYIDDSVEIGKGTIIYPDNNIRGNVKIGSNCVIESGNIIENAVVGSGVSVIKSVLKNCNIGAKTTVGPFANIHSNSIIAKNCRIGNFVEIKNSNIGINTKMAHLAYIGDVDIGNQCNIGCGSIFVNYDGKNKHRSRVGDSVFIGSNSNIIAPVMIEDNAYIAAGTTVTVDLPKNCMCIGRNRETIKMDRSKYKKNVFNKKYFGTDGIRGVYGESITEKIAYYCGNFLGYSSDGGTVVLGRDNRVSGESLKNALINGITDAGAKVVDLGIVSTPCVAFVTQNLGANYGIVVSASHNPPQYNGLKIFNFDGRKLTDIEEVEIEAHIENGQAIKADIQGKVLDGTKYINDYFDSLCDMTGRLDGMKIVIDCSNGAVSSYAPKLFRRLGAEIIAYNTSRDGNIINDECGALFPEVCSKYVIAENADLGFSYDGDADRIIAVNGKGNIIDGDKIIYMIGKYLKKLGKLSGNAVVGTVYTNLGVEQSLADIGINLYRTDVGDHYVMEKMMRDNLTLGGEQSGHIILRDFANTGDGLLISLFLCKMQRDTGIPLDEYDDSMQFPQASISLRTDKKIEISGDESLQSFIKSIEKEIDGKGRILLRASGTEPKIRIMAECNSKTYADEIVKRIENFINNTLSV